MQPEIKCGICNLVVKSIKLKTPIPVSKWDKQNNYMRDQVWNCCGRTWLINPSKLISEDQGPAIEV